MFFDNYKGKSGAYLNEPYLFYWFLNLFTVANCFSSSFPFYYNSRTAMRLFFIYRNSCRMIFYAVPIVRFARFFGDETRCRSPYERQNRTAGTF